MKRALLILFAAALVVAGFGSCAPAKPKVKTFVMVPKGVHPYYVPCFQGFQDAGAKYGIKTLEVDPQKFDVTLQVKVIEDLIAQKVDGITISANDDAGLVPVIHEAMKAGIKVITFDAPAPSSEALTYIGTDNQTAGATAAKKMAELMGNKGNLVILQGGLGATNLNLRTQGFKDAMAQVAPNIKILEVVDEGGDFAQTVNKTEAILQTYPKLNAIFAVSAEGAPGAAQVLQQEHKNGKIILAGFDDLKDTLEGIRNGTISFCLVQKTYAMGWLSVEKLLDAINNKPIPKVIDTGVLIVDKSNVDTYMADMKKQFQQ
ncbi:MAG TPA: sugar-binding protein [Rectinemataceae bacterium]|nr:sugar-binding protein [Rectinemataceae bacterium]